MTKLHCPCCVDLCATKLAPIYARTVTGSAGTESGSTRSFTLCCGRYLEKSENPRTVSQLMRSRYSAFALGGYGEYLLSTWHPSTVGNLTAIELSAADMHWQSLDIVSTNQRGNTGQVEFKASFLASDGATEIHHEISSFVREGGRWLYVDGEIIDA